MDSTLTTLREFKRHYHRARMLQGQLKASGAIQFKLKSDTRSVTSRVHIPDEKLAIRFSLVMRRFLASPSDLYLPRIWAMIVRDYSEHIPEGDRQGFNDGFAHLQKGPIDFTVSDRNLSAKDVYELMAKGEVFASDESASSLLRSYFERPIVGELFRFQFFAYSTNGLALASGIFGMIQHLESLGVIASGPSAIGNEAKCIYCLSSEGQFRSEEHIIPEALGWHDAVLSIGVVCDRCNNDVLSQLDSTFIQFDPIGFLHVLFVPYTKSGKYPQANFQNLSISKKGPRHIEIVSKDRTADIRNQKDLGDGWHSWSQPFTGKKLDPVALGRSVYKIGLGFVALKQDREHAIDPRFDCARAFIRGESLFDNRLLLSSNVTPHHGFQVQYMDLSPGTMLALDVFGVIFLFNLEPRPLIEPREEFKQLGFLEFDLSRPR